MAADRVEPWLRGTHGSLPPLQRAVVHALELALEDGAHWTRGLTSAELQARPYDLPSIGFQMRHTGRSLDRLLTYAEGKPLGEDQLHQLGTEHDADLTAQKTVTDFDEALRSAMTRVLRFSPEQMKEARAVGRAHLPTSVAGLLIHVAEHTQRHVGQLVTTVKVIRGLRFPEAV